MQQFILYVDRGILADNSLEYKFINLSVAFFKAKKK